MDRARTAEKLWLQTDPHRMLTDLLAWNEDMVVQLRAERGDDPASGFLSTLIAQHEKTVCLLHAELDARRLTATGAHRQP